MSSTSGLHHTPSGLLKTRLDSIWQRIEKAALASGRTRQDVQLVAVTKTVPVEQINAAIACGVRLIGENRVQEAASKRLLTVSDASIRYHALGTLQTNKARKAIELFDVIESVDRPRLAETLNRLAGELGKIQSCYAEIKISSEPTKSGIPLDHAAEFVRSFQTYSHLTLDGLMTIGALHQSPEDTRRAFRLMKNFFEEHRAFLGQAPVLSMGMSDDFEMAIEEGSTMVRIGRALFGDRESC